MKTSARKSTISFSLWRHSDGRAVLCGALLILAVAVTVIACTWSLVTDHSVRFNTYRYGRGFYRLPPLSIAYDTEKGKELTTTELNESSNIGDWDTPETSAEQKETPSEKAWNESMSAIDSADIQNIETHLKEFLRLTAQPTMYEGESERHWQRNTAWDMLDAISAGSEGASSRAVKEYLDARRSLGPAAGLPESPATVDVRLRDNWEYLHAAALYLFGNKEEALAAFKEHAAKYPRSEKNEAALYMAAKLTMEASHGFDNSHCGIDEDSDANSVYQQQIESSKIEPIENCRDDNWQKALSEFRALMKKYPKGRLVNDARGWIAYLYRRGGNRAEALVEYYRLLGDRSDLAARLEAKKSLQMIGHEYDDATLDKVESVLAGEPDAAMAYAYHRIYNVAIDNSYREVGLWCCSYSGNDSDEQNRVKKANWAGEHELERVARFASSMMSRYPHAKLSGGFVVRVAEAQIELKKYDEAKRLAEKAISLGIAGDLRAEALWIKGSAEHANKNLKAARKTFNLLISEFPKGKLTEGARRLLAMLAEDEGDLETALEQYLALNYEYDVAYLVDVLMPSDRLARFLDGHKDIPKYNELLYGLGVRYMRERRWADARAVYVRVNSTPVPKPYRSPEYATEEPSPKEPYGWGDVRQELKTSWVMQDLQTIDTLEHLEYAVEAAQGDEAKAEALYQLASFQFDADELLFYNAAAWKGMRSDLLLQLSTSENMRLPNESQLIFEYSKSHETLARAIPIYFEIFEKYPKTKAAADAMFSAAVAQERVMGLNGYWRNLYENGLFVGPRDIRFSEIGRAYRKFRWPKSRLGWEASTRTVNGGYPYNPLPRHAPKLSITQRIERRLKPVAETIKEKLTAAYGKIRTTWSTLNSTLVGGFVYGVFVALGLWATVWTVVGLTFRTAKPELKVTPTENSIQEGLPPLPSADSRVERIIKTSGR